MEEYGPITSLCIPIICPFLFFLFASFALFAPLRFSPVCLSTEAP